MSHLPFAFASTIRRMHEGPLGPHIDEFARCLHDRGFRRSSVRGDLVMVAHLSRWLERHDLKVQDLTDQKVAQFLRDRRRRHRMSHGDRPALRRFLDHLCGDRVIAPPAVVVDKNKHPLEDEFSEYLRTERALSMRTIGAYAHSMRRFLSERHNGQRIERGTLRASDVTRFFLCRTRSLGPGIALTTANALRAFFRFLRVRGKCDRDFSGTVPSSPRWRLRTLPPALTPGQIEKLLRSCDRTTPEGRRTFAVLLLMLRLGLRSGEVTRLSLDDVDWSSGEITVHGKGHRIHRLPLPKDVGRSLVAYLRQDRRRCESRSLFIRLRAPYTAMRQRYLGTRVRAALDRAGLHVPRRGSHLLRHTAATQMLRRGVSLALIGQVLNHRHPDTTAIYAKVDVGQLRSVAQPWPGGVR